MRKLFYNSPESVAMNLRSVLGWLLVLGFLAFLAHPIAGAPDDIINVRYFRSPVLNGAVATGEYPTAVLITTTASVYMSYDDDYYYVAAVITDGTDNGVNDRFQLYIAPYSRGAAPKTTDSMLEVRRDGSAVSYSYYSGWTADAGGWPSSIEVRVVSGLNTWSLEMKIRLTARVIDIPPGMNRTLGYMIRVYNGEAIMYESPTGASPTDTSTWGTIMSTSWWGAVDLELVGITYTPPLIVGRSTRITVVFRNAGPSPLSNVQVDLTINGVAVAPKQFLGQLRTGETGSVQFDWVAGDGTFRFVATVSIIGGEYEKNSANNVADKTLTPDWLTLSVLAPAGISVTVGGNTVESSGSEIPFPLPWGQVQIAVSSVQEMPGTRLVFKQWRPAVGTGPSIPYNLTSSVSLEAVYDVFYLCSFNFKDKANRAIQGLVFNLHFPNGTTRQLTAPASIWMPVGTTDLVGAYVGGLNVLAANQSIVVQAPIELTYYVNLRDVALKVVDVFGLPVAGATMTVGFLNGTTITREIPSDGVVTIARVPLGLLNATAEFLSFSSSIQVDASIAHDVWTITLPLSYPVLGVLIGVPAIVLIIVIALIIRSKLRR